MHKDSSAVLRTAADPGGLLARMVRERWQMYGMQASRCRRRASEHAIHDLRVAARRLIAVLDILAALLPDPELRKARRDLKRQLKDFNALRDVHVQLLRVRPMARTAAVLRPFVTRLAAQEANLVRHTGRHLARVRTRQIEQWMAGMEPGVVALFSRPAMARAGREALTGAAAAAFSRAVQRREQIAPSDGRTIHTCRIAFKKARYTLEALRLLLPWVTDRRLKAMNRYQTAMGEIQDLEVLSASIKAFALERPAAAGSFLPVYQDLARQRAEQMETFLRQADEIYTFWGGSGRVVPPPPRHSAARRRRTPADRRARRRP